MYQPRRIPFFTMAHATRPTLREHAARAAAVAATVAALDRMSTRTFANAVHADITTRDGTPVRVPAVK